MFRLHKLLWRVCKTREFGEIHSLTINPPSSSLSPQPPQSSFTVWLTRGPSSAPFLGAERYNDTTMATNAYKYDPLDKAADEVRLVTIKAGKATNNIQCTLSKHLSSERPSYEALSYIRTFRFSWFINPRHHPRSRTRFLCIMTSSRSTCASCNISSPDLW